MASAKGHDGCCPRRGLYAVTDTELTRGQRLVDAVAEALAGGAVMVQYRDKSSDSARRRREATALNELCSSHGVPLIVNDDPALARQAGAAGVHLGAQDAPLAGARELLGPKAIIGCSCYNRLELARQAAANGADYVAFGSFFPSPTKPAAVRAPPELLSAARRELSLPIAAIGGIDPDNAVTLLRHGAGLLAVISALFAVADVEAAARGFRSLFATEAPSSSLAGETEQ